MTFDSYPSSMLDYRSPNTFNGHVTAMANNRLKNPNPMKYWKYLLAVAGLVIFCFMVTWVTQIGISLTPLSPYDPAYYGWSNILSGRRILAVLNSDLNPCALQPRKAIIIEMMDTVTATAPINGKPTLSPFEVVLTLDPTGRTTVMERPLAAKYDLIKYDISVNKFWRKKGCENSFGSMFMTTPVAPRLLATPTPISAK